MRNDYNLGLGNAIKLFIEEYNINLSRNLFPEGRIEYFRYSLHIYATNLLDWRNMLLYGLVHKLYGLSRLDKLLSIKHKEIVTAVYAAIGYIPRNYLRYSKPLQLHTLKGFCNEIWKCSRRNEGIINPGDVLLIDEGDDDCIGYFPDFQPFQKTLMEQLALRSNYSIDIPTSLFNNVNVGIATNKRTMLLKCRTAAGLLVTSFDSNAGNYITTRLQRYKRDLEILLDHSNLVPRIKRVRDAVLLATMLDWKHVDESGDFNPSSSPMTISSVNNLVQADTLSGFYLNVIDTYGNIWRNHFDHFSSIEDRKGLKFKNIVRSNLELKKEMEDLIENLIDSIASSIAVRLILIGYINYSFTIIHIYNC